MKAKSYECVRCGVIINEIYFKRTSRKGFEDQNKMWGRGVVFTIQAGYGSSLDGNIFTGALCDMCIDEMASEKTIKFVRDYINGSKKYIPLRTDPMKMDKDDNL